MEMRLTAGVTGQQRMLIPRHLIPLLVYPGVRVCPIIEFVLLLSLKRLITFLNFGMELYFFAGVETKHNVKLHVQHCWRPCQSSVGKRNLISQGDYLYGTFADQKTIYNLSFSVSPQNKHLFRLCFSILITVE